MSNIDQGTVAFGIGHNEPDLAVRVGEDLQESYKALQKDAADALKRAEAVPEVIENEDQLEQVNTVVVELRDLWKRAEADREKEKAPFWRAGQAVDGYFNEIKTRLAQIGDLIGKRGHAYNQKKIAEARAKAIAEQREREAEAQRLRDAEEAKRKAAIEAEQAAERARKAENIAAHQEVAAEHNAEADQLAQDARIANIAASEAAVQANVKSADLVRTQFASGRMTTARQVGYVEIVDIAKLDLEKLRPYFKEEHVLAALKAFAKITNHQRPMDGAIIEMRDATRYT